MPKPSIAKTIDREPQQSKGAFILTTTLQRRLT